MSPLARPHLALHRRSWRIRTGLLVPILLVVPLFLAVTAVLWEGVARREATALVARRQDTALAGLSATLQARRAANETIVYLLSKRDGLGGFVETSNIARLAQTLIVMQASLDLSYINVYSSGGQRLLHVGDSDVEGIDRRLVADAVLGHAASSAGTTREGLVVSAAAVVSGSTQTAGVIVVGTRVPAASLREHNSAGDVAVFTGGQLVDSSVERTDVLSQLDLPIRGVEDVDGLNSLLERLHVRAAGMSIPSGGVVVAMVPIDDLERSSQQRTVVIIGGAVALLLVLVLITVVQARAIARPLENLVVVAGALVRGEYRRVQPSRNFEVHALGTAVNHLANQLEHKIAELTHQATHDSLSGLPNRKHFLYCLEQALDRTSAPDVAVLFLDLDSFKIVNDSLGHAAGDQLIVAVTARLRSFFDREPQVGAIIARLGGDEFTILLHDVAQNRNQLTARRVAEQLAETLAAPFQIGGYELVVSASIGLAHSAPDLETAEDVLRAADVAMYRAKSQGRATYVVYESAMGQRAAQRLDRETALRHAIESGAMQVHYQPIVDLTTGAVREVEALVRWHHTERGLISPGEFIPLAEETGLIVPLGRSVLQDACRQLRAWQLRYPSALPLTLSVNLSARQLQQPDLCADVRGILESTGVSPSHLTLEITESCLMQDAEVSRLRGLAAMGIKLAIDDFGTGYSSLARLSRLPINALKIDRSFVGRLGQEPESVAVVQTIVALAHALRMTVTAEGIEDATQAAQLRALGCSQGQGYYFGRPVPAAELTLPNPLRSLAA